MSTTKGIPVTEFELPYIRFITSGTKQEFYVTQARAKGKTKFTLWRPTPTGYVKDATANTPQELYEKIPKNL